MIRVHLTEAAPAGEAAEGTPAPAAADSDWKTLDELARTALLLARRLREQQDAEDRPAEAGEMEGAESGVTATAFTLSDLLDKSRPGLGAGMEVPMARDSPDM